MLSHGCNTTGVTRDTVDSKKQLNNLGNEALYVARNKWLIK